MNNKIRITFKTDNSENKVKYRSEGCFSLTFTDIECAVAFYLPEVIDSVDRVSETQWVIESSEGRYTVTIDEDNDYVLTEGILDELIRELLD